MVSLLVKIHPTSNRFSQEIHDLRHCHVARLLMLLYFPRNGAKWSKVVHHHHLPPKILNATGTTGVHPIPMHPMPRRRAFGGLRRGPVAQTWWTPNPKKRFSWSTWHVELWPKKTWKKTKNIWNICTSFWSFARLWGSIRSFPTRHSENSTSRWTSCTFFVRFAQPVTFQTFCLGAARS